MIGSTIGMCLNSKIKGKYSASKIYLSILMESAVVHFKAIVMLLFIQLIVLSVRSSFATLS